MRPSSPCHCSIPSVRPSVHPSVRPTDCQSIHLQRARAPRGSAKRRRERASEGEAHRTWQRQRASESLAARLPPSLPCSNFEAGAAEDHEAERKKLTRGDGGAAQREEASEQARMWRGTRLPPLSAIAPEEKPTPPSIAVAAPPIPKSPLASLHGCMGREGGTERLAGADGCGREGLKL